MRDNETLIFGLLFLAIVGFNVFKQFLAARAEQQRRQREAAAAHGMAQPEPAPQADPYHLTETEWGRPPEAVPAVPLQALPAPTLAAVRPAPVVARETARRPVGAARHRRRHRLFQTRRALRDGIVMITVLGPCRALQPYDQDHS